MEQTKAKESDLDMVEWADGTHVIKYYNDDNGYGLTGCGVRIGPWDRWLVGQVSCAKCKEAHDSDKR